MRLREMTGRLRGRDMEMGRVMEDKMRLLVEMLDEIGVEHNLSQVKTACQYSTRVDKHKALIFPQIKTNYFAIPPFCSFFLKATW